VENSVSAMDPCRKHQVETIGLEKDAPQRVAEAGVLKDVNQLRLACCQGREHCKQQVAHSLFTHKILLLE
jgi:hypothetical protein